MIRELLTALKMKGALEVLPSIERIVNKEQYLLEILKAEKDSRDIRALKKRMGSARFPVEKDWCDIDPSLNPTIKYTKVQELETGEFIHQRMNLCLVGQQGTGKTHSLIALGRQLCRRGITIKFQTACALVNALEDAKENHCLKKFMESLLKPQLLIIDELGFVPFSENGARLLFDVFASRYERGSIAVTSNLSFEKWIQIFGSIELTAALVDRFTHKCLIFNYQGDSVRLLQAKKTLKKAKL